MVYPRAFSGKPTRHTLRRMVGAYARPVENHSVPHSATHSTPRTAAFFDLDKTVIAKSSTLTFSKSFYQGGLINRRAVLRTAYAQFVFLAGGADHDQMERMRAYLSALCRGWDVAQVREIIAETLHELIDPLIYDEAASLIEEHHTAGRDVVIVSTSGAEVVEPIGALLGADRVVATRMVVGADGRFTGEVEYYAYGPTKAQAVRDLAASEGYDLARCYAYSDSATDVPMLEAVGHPYAVNPDRALRREAASRGWPVLSFTRPVQLKQRLPSLGMPSRPVLATVAAVGAAAATAGLVWYASRRRPVFARITRV
ncbi:morphological differentiation-associated protein [Streptomyces chrestomyceticus JCM 4735]|uniref:Morphological differentiation-associated protein n=2 Tax=Streptomyces chrestomyceticus TaxID=68185 RepID=A0A7U9PZ68_9ACTN|nr:morphological differentiation-associated protein [Streptomyces chrestomyceticus JCM 4735]